MRITEKLASASAHRVLCNSESLRMQALALGLAPASKLHMLGDGSSNGVDVGRFCPGPIDPGLRRIVPRDAPVVGYVGRLTKDKGVPELIAAFDDLLKIVPKARLLLVGWFDASEDALDPSLRTYIDRHPHIVRTGFVADTAPWYRLMDMLILPTWREGFPNVVLEAAATGVPVITTFATGARDAVVAEVTGLLIPPGYPEAILEAMLKLLANPRRRAAMGVAARAWVIENFLNSRVQNLTVAMYDSLLQRPQSPSLQIPQPEGLLSLVRAATD